MGNRTARTIDGMRVRSVDPSMRVVGFGDGSRAAARQAVAMRRAQAGVSSGAVRAQRQAELKRQTSQRKNDDFGLTRNNIEKQRARLKANNDFLRPVSTLELDLSSKDLRPDYSLKKRDVADVPRKDGRGGLKKPKKTSKFKKFAIAAVLIVVGLGAGAAIWGNDLISKFTGGESGIFELISAITNDVKLKTDENGRTNVLIFGTSGYDMSGSTASGEHDGSQLTDSIMVVSFDQETKDVAMVSLPRDLYVGNTCTGTGKVNEVFYCANLYGEDEKGGAEALMQAVEEIFDIDLQYRIHVDWSALIQVVNGIGGITVTLDDDIEDDWTGTYIKAGEPVTLNGEQALGLARARHGTTMGDFTRGDSQQKILAAIQDKVVNEGLDIAKVLNLMEIVGDNVRMNFSLEEIKSLFNIARKASLSNMRQIPLIDYENNIAYLTTATMNGISYVVPSAGIRNYTDIQTYIHKMISSDPAVREDAEILVLNGSGASGVAMNEQAKLNKAGYANVEIDDAPAGDYLEKYYVYDVSGETPASVKALSERYGVEVLGRDSLPADIMTDGVDVVIILGRG